MAVSGHPRDASAEQELVLDRGDGLQMQPPSPSFERVSEVNEGRNGMGFSLSDSLLAKLLHQVVPSGDSLYANDIGDERTSAYADRPGFSLPLMTSNFRRFNSRVGVLFVLQGCLTRLFLWKAPTHTASFLAVYTFLCLDPSLLVVLPFLVLLFFIMIPSFLVRHPPPPTNLSTDYYSPYGPPIAPPVNLRPSNEISKDFFRNLRDLQNSMEDFARLYDEVAALIGPPTNFSNEALSSAIFLFLCASACIMFFAAHLIPWRAIFLILGWAMTLFGHPALQRAFLSALKEHLEPREHQAKGLLLRWVQRDVKLDGTPEVREVEIFELQRRSGAGEWESWVFSPSPYDLLSAERVSQTKPRGTRFLEDVQAPSGWGWCNQTWALDMNSREWVEERLIGAVEVETEGERWVSDLSYEEREASRRSNRTGRTEPTNGSRHEGLGQPDREQWRRRRWVRHVQRGISKKET